MGTPLRLFRCSQIPFLCTRDSIDAITAIGGLGTHLYSDPMAALLRSILLCACIVGVTSCTASPPLDHQEVDSENDCAVCHLPEYEAATAPLHGGKLSEDCAQCHENQNFVPAPFFLHETFALQGTHAVLPCSSCHGVDDPLYEEMPGVCTDSDAGRDCRCEGCHASKAAAVAAPIHSGVLSSTCDRCHSAEGFAGATGFVHSGWELTGAHLTAACNDCHEGVEPPYAFIDGVCEFDEATGASKCRCINCHEPVADAFVPGHAGFSRECEQCHNTTSWSP